MVIWCNILASILAAFVILYGLLEVHYFLRMGLCVVLARFCKKKIHILDTSLVSGICLTNDIDGLLSHMNNARYLRELDFARVDFYERTKLYRTIVAKGGGVVQGAATIRYRRFIRPFSIFKITSRIIYWDSQSVFMEHRFINSKDKFIHCIAICRQRILNCSADDVMSILMNETNQTGISPFQNEHNICQQQQMTGTATATSPSTSTTVANQLQLETGGQIKFKPEMPLDIAKWMEYNEISSKNLRSGC